MPALRSGCARGGTQAKLGGGRLRGSMEQSGFLQVLMVCQMLLNFFTGLQKLLQMCLSPVPSFLPHTEPTPGASGLAWHRLGEKVLGLTSPGSLVSSYPPACFEHKEGGCPVAATTWASTSARSRVAPCRVTCLPLGTARLRLRAAVPSAEKHSRQDVFSAAPWKCAYFVAAALPWWLDRAVPVLPGLWLGCAASRQVSLHLWGGHAWYFTVLTLWL